MLGFTVGGRTLSVTTANTSGATGRVLLTDGIECRGACSVAYVQGTAVSLRAVADAGALFAGWSGACGASGLTLASSVTLTEDAACTATFAPAPPFPKVSPAGNTTVQGPVVSVSWGAVPNAEMYWFCVGTTSDLTCPAATASGWIFVGTATSGTWTAPGPGTYYWPFGFVEVCALRATLSERACGRRVEGWQAKVQTAAGGGYLAGRWDADGGVWWRVDVAGGPEAPAETSVTPGATGSADADAPGAGGPSGASLGLAALVGAAVIITRRRRQRFDVAGGRIVTLLCLSVVFVLSALAGVAAGQTPPANPGGTIEYYHLDALGSVRVVTDAAGQEVRRHDFLPFGEEWPTPQTAAPETHLFTGKERDPDTESGLDYFGARFYDRQVGRFTTVDPAMTLDENLVDPQRWNRYAYVRNNPLKYTDPDGRAVFASTERLREVGTRVMAALQPFTDPNGVRHTFCNWGVRDILRAGDDHTLDNMTPSQMVAYLSKAENATPLSPEQTVEYAKAGATVIMAEPGHVAVVAPEDLVKASSNWEQKTGAKYVPQVYNVGGKNGLKAVDWAFNTARPPTAYILNTDKAIVDKEKKKH